MFMGYARTNYLDRYSIGRQGGNPALIYYETSEHTKASSPINTNQSPEKIRKLLDLSHTIKRGWLIAHGTRRSKALIADTAEVCINAQSVRAQVRQVSNARMQT
jgi:hypothetical protein